MKSQLLTKASKDELSTKDADDFRRYYNHLLSFEKNVSLSGIDTRQILDESQEKILAKVESLKKEIISSISNVVAVAAALMAIKFYAENLSMFEKHINDEIDNALKYYKSRQGAASITTYIFAIWTLKNTQHYNAMRGIDAARAYLLMPHVGQVIAIFRLLGIGYEKPEVSKAKNSSKKIISDDLMNN
ncbi:unnamed protein product [Rotaria sp. Silwood2]|nr:unnamed protein product [Rotaria sp. Silwood2]CAF4745945.1 unnamed protein product [Rotaria sp. Silwood2]